MNRTTTLNRFADTAPERSGAPRASAAPFRAATRWLAGAMAALTLVGPAAAMPEPGEVAPGFTLTSLDGQRFSLAQFEGRAVVVFFGELGQERTNQTAATIERAIEDRRMVEDEAVVIMIVAHKPEPDDADEARPEHLPDLILHDPERQAFGAYRIVVVPSVIVVGTDGRVVYAAPGFVPRFRRLLGEALLVATGLETPEAFEETVHPPADDRTPSEVRVDRLVRLGEQLRERGLYDMAEGRFREAIGAAPDLPGPHLALGRLLLERGRLDEAEAEFRAALASSPDSVEASLGVAETLLRRGPDEQADAERILRDALAANPDNARAHYLIGTLHQRRDEHEEAALAFRRAAELLLEQ